MSNPLKVLVVEDTEDDVKLVLRALRHGEFDPTYRCVQTAAGLEAALAQESWDAVISDFRMPGFTGMDALRIFRSTGLDIPFVLVSGTMGEEAAVDAMKAGASDYIMKKSLARLAPTLKRELKQTQVRAGHRRSESLKGAILEASLDCIITMDHDGKIVEFNPAAEAAFGLSRERALGRDMADLIIPARFRDAHRRGLAHYLASGEGPILGKRRELEAIRADGTEFPIELAITVTGATSEPMFTAFVRDITARKQAANELRESERRFSDMLGNIDMVSLMLDANCRITHVNDYLLRLTGWRREEVIGGDWFELFIPPELTDLRDVSAALLANKPEASHHENEILTRSGERRLIRWNNSVLRSGIGEVIGTASIGEDITEQKRAEIGIKHLNRVHAVLSGINALIVRVRDRHELFVGACRIAVDHGNFAMAWIGMLDPATQDVTPVAWAGEAAEALTRVKSSARDDTPRGKGAVGQAIRERRPVFNNDIAAHGFGGPRLKEIQGLGFQSQITLPLCEDESVVGTLTMYAKEPDFFDEEEVRLLTALAGDISLALENISRQRKLAKQARIRAFSSEINAGIIRVHDAKALLRETSRIAVEHGKFEMVWIASLDLERQEVRPVAWAGFSPQTAHAVTWASIGTTQGTLGEAILTLRAAVRNDIEGKMAVGILRQEALAAGCGSTVCLPLLVDGKMVAAIILFATGRHFFDAEELALLNEVAANLSFALQAIDKQGRLDHLAYYDVLTGLANRSLFLERVAQYMRGAVSGGHKLAVGLIDLERFKNINDSLGQAAGDSLLKQVAKWLTFNLGDASMVARMDADHFAVVLPEIAQEGSVVRLIEKLVSGFLEHPFRLDDAVFRVAAKVGVALYPDDGADAGTLFKNAEAALKKAKASGERYLFYMQQMTETVAIRLTLETQLRQALDNEEFVLHYQPKVSLDTGKITGAEALIRWNDPRTGLVPPGRFIPILEETGLIHDVGRWALHKAVADYLRWRTAGLPAVRIAVNVSPLQLRNRGFIAEIEHAIGIADANAGLELEITESLIMQDVKHSIASLQAIRALGVSIAIDDFGTGFSSLSYLSKLPVDTLKIDRSFVTDMTAGPEGLALVSTVIALAHSLKLKVVAEGVETEEQSHLLRLLDCDEMQGFLFSKPVPIGIFETRYLAPPPGEPIQAGKRFALEAMT